jgi:hypothetical protein
MFTNKRYAQALVAFQRAGGTREAAICHAFLLRENARALPDDRLEEKLNAFGTAGQAFYTCANGSLPNQRRARLAYYTNAAECFVQGNRQKEAADCFELVEQYGEAARAYLEGGNFDELAQVLERHGHQIEADLLAQLAKGMAMLLRKWAETKCTRSATPDS